MNSKIMVVAFDSGDMPRCWGAGPTFEAAIAECRRQLALYLADPRLERGTSDEYTLRHALPSGGYRTITIPK